MDVSSSPLSWGFPRELTSLLNCDRRRGWDWLAGGFWVVASLTACKSAAVGAKRSPSHLVWVDAAAQGGAFPQVGLLGLPPFAPGLAFGISRRAMVAGAASVVR